MSVIIGDRAEILAEIRRKYRAPEGNDQWINPAQHDQDMRVYDVMLKIWPPPTEKDILDHLIEFTDETVAKFKNFLTRERTNPAFENAEDIEDIRIKVTPWWDVELKGNGIVTSIRAAKVRKILTEYENEIKISSLKELAKPVFDLVDKETPNELFKRIRSGKNRINAKQFTDDEIYLFIHLFANKKQESRPLDQENLFKGLETPSKWSSWKEEKLNELLKKEGLENEFAELKKLSPENLRTFSYHLKTVNAKTQLVLLSQKGPEWKGWKNPLLSPALKMQRTQLWNCLPKEMQEHFACIDPRILDHSAASLMQNSIMAAYQEILKDVSGQVVAPDFWLNKAFSTLEELFKVSAHPQLEIVEKNSVKISFVDVENRQHAFFVTLSGSPRSPSFNVNVTPLQETKISNANDKKSRGNFWKLIQQLVAWLVEKIMALPARERKRLVEDNLKQIHRQKILDDVLSRSKMLPEEKEKMKKNYQGALVFFDNLMSDSLKVKIAKKERVLLEDLQALAPEDIQRVLNVVDEASVVQGIGQISKMQLLAKAAKINSPNEKEIEQFIHESEQVSAFFVFILDKINPVKGLEMKIDLAQIQIKSREKTLQRIRRAFPLGTLTKDNYHEVSSEISRMQTQYEILSSPQNKDLFKANPELEVRADALLADQAVVQAYMLECNFFRDKKREEILKEIEGLEERIENLPVSSSSNEADSARLSSEQTNIAMDCLFLKTKIENLLQIDSLAFEEILVKFNKMFARLPAVA